MFDGFPAFGMPSEEVPGQPLTEVSTLNENNKWDELDLEITELFKGMEASEQEINPITIPVAEQITEASKELRAVNAEITLLAEQKAEIFRQVDKINADARKRIAELNEISDALTSRQTELKRERDALKRKIEELKRRLQLEIDKIRKSLEFKIASKEYDINTAGLVWREFAMGYQIMGAQILANSGRKFPSVGPGQGCILGDDMGLGKTLTLLIALDMLKAKRVLIVCPADVTTNFEKEAKRWAPHRPVVSIYKWPQGQRNAMIQLMKMTDEVTLLVNYESWRRDPMLVTDLATVGFDTVVLDEAHNIKNASTAAFHGVRDIVMAENCCAKCGGLDIEQKEFASKRYSWVCNKCNWDSRDIAGYTVADRRSVKNVFPATGTPILNKPQELFTLLHLIMPEVFEKEVDFLSLYCEQDWSGYWRFKQDTYGNPVGMDRLQRHLSGRYIARDEKTLNEEGIFIPKQDLNIHDIDITSENYPDQYRIIQQINKHAQIILSSGRRLSMINQLEIILRQRQANVWPGGIQLKDEDKNVVWSVGDEVQESIKVDFALNMIDAFTMADHRCVVFSQFKPGLRVLADRLNQRGIKAVVFDGETPERIREQIKEDFDLKYCARDGYEPKWDVVLCNYRTGGVGLNFTAATRTIVTDEEWNPGKNSQAWARTRRIGQERETEVHIIRVNKTIDAWLARLNDFKKNVVTGWKASADEMQADMLRALEGGEFL